MAKLIRVADSFVNVRQSFKIGPLNIGTHSSLVRRKNGKWLMLDSVQFEPEMKAQVDSMTGQGKEIEAILNTHPFHTLSCEWAHQAYPDAKLYGTARHHSKLPDLPWQGGLLEDPKIQAEFKDDLQMRIPKGVDFISSNDQVHFSAIQVYHSESKTLHTDDTFMFIPTPKVAEVLNLKQGTVQLHPTLAGALESRSGASDDFRNWTKELASDWQIDNLLAAHSGALLASENTGESIAKRLLFALKLAEPVLAGHDLMYRKKE